MNRPGRHREDGERGDDETGLRGREGGREGKRDTTNGDGARRTVEEEKEN
jgi:hypothetical protein